VTAVLAALGSSDAARRTGFSHTIYNVFTAVAALLMLDAYTWGVVRIWPEALLASPELALVGFHTLFNVVAMLFGLPLAGPFTRLLEWLVPSDEQGFARRLDDRLLGEPGAAGAALNATLREEFDWLLNRLCGELGGPQDPSPVDSEQVFRDLLDTRDYLDRMNAVPMPGAQQSDVMTGLHVLDHLHRLHWRLRQSDRIALVGRDPALAAWRDELLGVAAALREELPSGVSVALNERAARLVRKLAESDDAERVCAISLAVEHDHSAAQTGHWLEARRWLARVAHHLWRAGAHLGGHVSANQRPD
jgi:phosphate:Na+ symporter